MAITDLQSLQDQVQDHLDRTDVDDPKILTFIGLLEGNLYGGERAADGRGWNRKPLRLRKQLVSGASLTVTDGSADVTTLTRWIEFKGRLVTDTALPQPIEVLAPEDYWTRVAAYTATPIPPFATIEGDTLYLGTASVDLIVTYYQRFAPLADPTDTNWLLTNHPAVYLHGVLAEAYHWSKDMKKRDEELARLNGLVAGVDSAEENAALSGTVLIMRPPAVV